MTRNVIDLNARRRAFDDAATREKMRRYFNDEITWAEVEGMTFEQAQQIGKLGCELAAKGRLQDARIIFEGLVAGNPKDTCAQAALGTVYQRLNRNDDARVCYDRAIELCEDNIVALANRGELRLRSGDVDGVADLTRAVKLDEKGMTAPGRRARALLKFLVDRAAAAANKQAAAR
ncbi:MAG: tetratricopeptide repeat protein [Myxococcales bacterium]|jgi:Flp pilus assembly protein TadD